MDFRGSNRDAWTGAWNLGAVGLVIASGCGPQVDATGVDASTTGSRGTDTSTTDDDDPASSSTTSTPDTNDDVPDDDGYDDDDYCNSSCEYDYCYDDAECGFGEFCEEDCTQVPQIPTCSVTLAFGESKPVQLPERADVRSLTFVPSATPGVEQLIVGTDSGAYSFDGVDLVQIEGASEAVDTAARADLDGDGLLDLVLGHPGRATVSFGSGASSEVLLGGNGVRDLAVFEGEQGLDALAVLSNDGSAWTVDVTAESATLDVPVLDDVQQMKPVRANDQLGLLLELGGSSSFYVVGEEPVFFSPQTYGPRRVATGDGFGGAGTAAVWAAPADGYSRLYWLLGETVEDGWVERTIENVSMADLDGDGRSEWIGTNVDGLEIVVFEDKGQTCRFSAPLIRPPTAIASGSFDGEADVLALVRGGGGFSLMAVK